MGCMQPTCDELATVHCRPGVKRAESFARSVESYFDSAISGYIWQNLTLNNQTEEN